MPHFEIYAADVAAAQTFYAGLFGWRFAAMPEMGDLPYWIIEGPGFTDGSGGGLTGALAARPDDTPASGAPIRGGMMTFDVADCDASYAWALANGGSAALPPEDYPGVGRCASVEDGQGNVVGMVTPAETN